MQKQTAKQNKQQNKKQYTARCAALMLLRQILKDGAYTNIAISQFLQRHPLEDLERRFFTELVYGTVKALGTLDWYLEQCVNRPLEKVAPDILNILRLGAYQLLYLERIPASAACNESVKLARSVSHEGSAKFVNGVLRGLLRKQEAGEFAFPDATADDAGYLALKYYHPRWLVKRWLGPWGRGGTERLLEFNNSAAPVCLRVNTMVMNRGEFVTKLEEAGCIVHPSTWSADGVVCEKLPALQNVFAQLHNAFYVQDESSMLVADVVDAKPGMQVLDLCSAPGGKSTHLAQRMANQGSIISCDIHEHKLKLIAANANRLGLSIITPLQNDACELRSEWQKKFDRVLVDAPCSGMGVLRRRAEARWRKTRHDLKLFPPLQLKILDNAAEYVADGGLLVYSTCTIEQSENHYLVEEFLSKHPDWERCSFTHPQSGEVVAELQLLPQVDGVDGFYICALRKKA